MSAADLVQELYLKELRGYKPPPVKPGEADAHVQKFTMPPLPPSPEEGDIARDLKAYESQEVEVEGQAASTEEGTGQTNDWFEDGFAEDEEEPQPSH